MDGLLLDTERVAQDSFVDAAVAFHIDQSQAAQMFLHLVGHSWAENMLQLQGFIPADQMDPFRTLWKAGFAERMEANVPLRPHVREVIEHLSKQTVTMAVVTSTATEQARNHLARAGLLDAFVTVIGGDAVPAHKPDPSPYIAGAAAVGEAPQACVAFEDSDPGVQSATTAGCTVWQIPDLRPPDRLLPDLGQSVADTLRDATLRAGLAQM